jgi:hypothetical protein
MNVAEHALLGKQGLVLGLLGGGGFSLAPSHFLLGCFGLGRRGSGGAGLGGGAFVRLRLGGIRLLDNLKERK